MDWDKLRIFHAVAEAGSFTHAAEKLNLSQSAISRQVSALEESVKTPLFHRHARGLILTEQGDMLYKTVQEVFHKLTMAQNRLTDSKELPSGPLRVTATLGLGNTWLTPLIKEFIELYPEVELHLILSDTEVDLSMRQADVAIRMSAPRQPDLIQRPLMTVRHKVYAADEYIEKYGEPKDGKDLDNHRIITFGDDTPQPVSTINWLIHTDESLDNPRVPIVMVNNIYGIYRAARSGLGIASIPEYMIPEESNLQHILPELEGPPIPAYFVYPEEMRHSKRITVFRDFLLRKVAEADF
ncbi:LysR family transcriptional regulator [Curvivirga aplysinae]|uniref:LysR family transcriptional regulator n=1 Tax=Curvivirga aplysinae TaxID=2529852 RepID=UPI0012BB6A44|nr:LysR family transcriptional regulator [Curvivirga aplysinae]MTI10925.1 LysR family transcriptional regulator [Curvivirga aplysinae]